MNSQKTATGFRLWQCAFVSLCLVMLPVQANIGQSGSLAGEVARESGMLDLVASYPEQISAHIHQSASANPTPVDQTRAIGLLLKAFDRIDAAALLERFIRDNTRPDDLRTIHEWFDSGLGRRFSAAEQAVTTVDGQLGEQDFIAGLAKHDPRPERVKLIQHFEQAAALHDINYDMITIMMKSEMAAMNRLLPVKDRMSDAEISARLEKKMHDMPPMMSVVLWQQMLEISQYTYRDFTDAELTSYIHFLESDAGRVLVSLYKQVPEYVFGKVIEEMEHE